MTRSIACAMAVLAALTGAAGAPQDAGAALLARFLQEDLGRWRRSTADPARTEYSSDDRSDAALDMRDLSVLSYTRGRRRDDRAVSTPKVSRERAEAIALGFVRRSGGTADREVLSLWRWAYHPDDGLYRFEYRVRQGEVALPVLWDADIDGTDGSLVRFGHVDHRPLRIALGPPRVTREDAARIAKAEAAESGMKDVSVEETDLLVWLAYWLPERADGQLTDQQALLWSVRVRGSGEVEMLTGLHGIVRVPTLMEMSMHVDASTGDVRQCEGPVPTEERAVLRARLPVEPSEYRIFDYSPTWRGMSELYFCTTRATRPPGPDYRRPEECATLARVSLASGRIEALVPDAFGWGRVSPSVSPDQSRIALVARDYLAILRFADGALGWVTAHPHEGHGGPCWSSDGRSLVATKAGPGSIGLSRILLDATGLRPTLVLPLLDTPSEDVRPLIARDGTWLFFVREESDGAGGARCALCRTQLDKEGKPEGPVTVIKAGMGVIPSCSLFPDGDRVLACGRDRLYVVNVTTQECTPLDLPELHDPDHPTWPPLSVSDAVPSPDGTRLAFCGLLWTGKREDAASSYIYTCRLDGTELRRVTPLDEAPLLPYVFKPGRTAYDVANAVRTKTGR